MISSLFLDPVTDELTNNIITKFNKVCQNHHCRFRNSSYLSQSISSSLAKITKNISNYRSPSFKRNKYNL